MKPFYLTAFLAAAFVLAPSASAQRPDVLARPLYTTLNLESGFLPDPRAVSVIAGGSDGTSVQGCAGYITAAQPDVDVNYTAGEYVLFFYVESDYDTTLLINLPDGSWVCDDDSGRGLNAFIELNPPLSGNYNIWVGTYGSDVREATLYVAETRPRGL